MFTIYKLLFNIHLERDSFYFIVKRCLVRSTIRSDEDDLNFGRKSKGKITVLKRKLKSDDGKKVLEWKYAADVIKKLNWENSQLFGPIQTSRTNKSNLDDIFKTNKIIQHETRIPITEPIVHQNTEINNSVQTIDLGHILAFPLENKLMSSTDKVFKLNLLRKHLEHLSKGSIPSVSSILQQTMPEDRKKNLNKWKQNMINELGEEGFQRYHTALLENGCSLHNNISSYLSSTPKSELEIKEENIGHWNSLNKVLSNIKDVKLLEEFVTHPFLYYRGVVDCFAKYMDHLVVIDWKTSKKVKPQIKDVFDNPLQIAAYVGALNFDPKFQYLATKGLIVVAYDSGIPATLHFIDSSTMKHYWKEWLKRVKKFWEMKTSETENL